jgi:hypothetical protein
LLAAHGFAVRAAAESPAGRFLFVQAVRLVAGVYAMGSLSIAGLLEALVVSGAAGAEATDPLCPSVLRRVREQGNG